MTKTTYIAAFLILSGCSGAYADETPPPLTFLSPMPDSGYLTCETRYPDGYNTCHDQHGNVMSDNAEIEMVDGVLQYVDKPSPMQKLIDEVKALRKEINEMKGLNE